MFTRYSPPPTVKTSSIGLPPRLVQTLCVEAARKVQRGRHTGRHGILERRFQHNASVDDLHRHLELVVQPDVQIGRHTSELQSLMRISYAVFCLKNKKTHPPQANPQQVT